MTDQTHVFSNTAKTATRIPEVIVHPTDVAPRDGAEAEQRPVVFDVDQLSVFYGDYRAVRDVSLQIPENEITAFIGP
jgi:ABC-type transport system involved in cytochrome bd biosynthesis fused ATPase/permease subunit